MPAVVVASSPTSGPTDFATTTLTAGGQTSLVPFTSYGSITNDATAVADQSGSVATLSGATSLNALRIGAGGGVDLGGQTLKMGNIGTTYTGSSGVITGMIPADQAGMILSAGGGNAGIVNGTLDFGSQTARFITNSDLQLGTLANPITILTSVLTYNSGNTSVGGGLVKSGSGTLTIYGTPSTTLGVSGTIVTEGTLVLGNTNALKTYTTAFNLNPSFSIPNVMSNITVAAGATLDLNSLTFPIGNLFAAGNVALGNGTMYLGANNTISGSFTGSASSNLVIGYPYALAPLSNSFGSGQQTNLYGDNSGFSGSISILNGILKAFSTNALGTGTTPIVLGDTSGPFNASLNMGPYVTTLSRNVTVQAGGLGLVGINITSDSNLTLLGTLTLNRASSYLGGGVGSGVLTVAGQITGPGTLELWPVLNVSNNSAGNFYFTNATNNYTGGTIINAGATSSSGGGPNGTIAVGNDTVFPLTGTFTFGSNPGMFKAENGARTISNTVLLQQTTTSTTAPTNIVFGAAGQNDITFSGPITPFSSVGSQAMTLTINAINTGLTTLGGAIGNGGVQSLGIIKNGPSTVALNGANSFSGTTVINGGTLRLGNPSALGNGGRIATLSNNGGTTVATGAVLDLNGQQGIVEVLTLSGGSLINSSSTRAIVTGGAVSSISLSSVGAVVSAVPTISITGGGGSGATAVASLGLTAASFAVTSAGSGYDLRALTSGTAIPTVAITGGGGGAVVTPKYGITSADYLVASGGNYTALPTGVTFSTPTGGTAATGHLVVTGTGPYTISSIVVDTPGSGYTTVPSPSITGGSPTASASITRIDGFAVITGVNLTATGSGYTNGGTFTFGTNTSYGVAASGTINATNFGVGVMVTNPGTGYTTAPTVAITGSTATATANLTSITLTATSNVGGTGDLEIDSPISSSGAFGINKIGSGTVYLNGNDTFTGSIAINAGKLQFGSPASVGGTGANVFVAFGATAAFGYAFGQSDLARIAPTSLGVVALAASTSNNLDFSAATGANLASVSLGASGGPFTFSGTLTPYANTYRLGGGGPGVLIMNTTLPDVGGPTNLIIDANGTTPSTVVLNGSNTFTGSITINASALQFGSPASVGGTGADIYIAFGATAAYGYAIGQSDLARILPASLGVIALAASTSNNLDFSTATGANLPSVSLGASGGTFTYSGTLTPNANTYRLGGGGGTLIMNTSLPDVGGPTKLIIDVNGTTLGTVVLTMPNTYSGGTSILNGTLNINSDSALGAAAGIVNLICGTLQFAAGGGITLPVTRSIALGGGAFDTNFGNDTISGVISGNDPVNSNLIKNGLGNLVLTNTNTYAGSTIVNAGGLVVGSTASLGSGPLMVNNTNPAPSSTDVYLYNTSGQTVGTLSGQITQASSGNTAGIFLSAGVTLTVNQTAPGTFQGTIFGSGSLVLGSSSTSTLTLTGNSTYGGSTTINGGTIQLGVANALPATTALTLGSGGMLNLNNNNLTIAALNSSAGNINTGSGTGGILTVGNTAGGTVTYSGVISGTGGLTWGIVNTNVPNPTPSTLLLTNTSTNTGPMSINTGTLSIGTAYALSGGVAPVLPYSPSNTYPGAFTLGPTATLLTNGFNLTVGSLGGGGPIGGNINLGNNSSSTLYIVQSSSTGYAGIISGTGNVYIVNGVNLAVYGNWTLTGGVTHDVTNLQGNHTDSPKSYLPFAIAGNSAVTTQGINFAGFTDQVSTIFGGSSADNNAAGTFVDTGSGGKLVLSYYAASVSAGGPSNGLGGNQTFSGFFMNDVGLIFDAGYWGTAQQMTLSGPNNTTGPLTIGFTNQTTPQFGAATGAQSGVANQVIVSATSTFGAVTVGNSVASNLVNNLTVMAGTGNLTAASVTIGESAAGSTGNNSVTARRDVDGRRDQCWQHQWGWRQPAHDPKHRHRQRRGPSRSAIPFRAARARTR